MGMYREFALRAMSMGRRRGRPPVFSAQAFWPYAAERTLAQAVREALLESWRRELAGAVEDSDEGDGGFESSVREAAERAAEAISANAGESLARFSEMTIGVPYLPAGTERAVLGEWTETFVKLCRSADAQGKADIARAVSGGKMRGENMRQVESAVEASLKGKAKSKAELIARTETGKLNNACTMAGYREAGITRYRWLATPDERTRPSHAAMNGRICAVGEPDTWYEDTERGLERRARTQDMYHGDPGTDFQCRCTCVPWDAAVDSKYGVREVPEPEPKEPSPLEREREENERLREQIERERRERAERERELENARKLAERRTEILRSANERHAARTEAERDSAKSRWWMRTMPPDMTGNGKLAMAKSWLDVERTLGIKKGAPMTAEQADEQKANPHYFDGKAFRINCQTCSPAYMMRLRGFNVSAKGNTPGSLSEWISRGHSFDIWKNPDGSKPKAALYTDFMTDKGYSKMTPGRYMEFFEENCKEVGVYVCTIGWKKSAGGGAHATILQRLPDGRLVYVEPQVYNGTSAYRDVEKELAKDGIGSGVVLYGRGVMRIDDKILDGKYLSIFDK